MSAGAGRPRDLVAGVGVRPGVPAGEVLALLDRALAGLDRAGLCCLSTLDARGGEEGILRAAALLGVPVATHPAAALARVRVPHPSAAVRAAVGTPSVAEAAALLGRYGRTEGARLLVPRIASAAATLAVARHPTGPAPPAPAAPPARAALPAHTALPAGPVPAPATDAVPYPLHDQPRAGGR